MATARGTVGLKLRGVPCHCAVRTIIRSVEAAELEAAFRVHAASLAPPQECGDPRVVAIDGKTLRGSFDAFNDRKAAHMLSAMCVEGAIVLAHVMVDDKSNEIPALCELVETLGFKNGLFTTDALHCQKTFQAVLDSGNYLPTQVKSNQPALLRLIRQQTAQAVPQEQVDDNAKGRNRSEHRHVSVFAPNDWFAGTPWQDLIRTVLKIERVTLRRCARTGLWSKCVKVAFHVSSAQNRTARQWADAIRGHWRIENSSHYVRDVTFAEDASRIRFNPDIHGAFAFLCLQHPAP